MTMRVPSRGLAAFFLSMICALCSGCGGGGGGGDSNIPGVWIGSVSLIDDSCGIITFDQQYLSFVHLVNQSGSAVTVDNGARTFAGQITAEDAFRAESSGPAVKPGCRETLSWRYERIGEDSVPFVVRKSVVECTGVGTCSTTWSGSAYRPVQGGGGPVPIPLYEDSAANAPQPVNDAIAEAAGAAE